MKIKICGNKYNIAAVAELKPACMGFVFYDKSPRCVSQDDLSQIKTIPPGIQRVGVFVNQELSSIIALVQEYQLDLIQLHGTESPEYCQKLNGQIKMIKALDGNSPHLQEEIEMYRGIVNFLLLDNMKNAYGGTGKKFDWQILYEMYFECPFFLSGGITLNDINHIQELNSLPYFYGIDVNSGFEEKPGYKNIEQLTALIQTI